MLENVHPGDVCQLLFAGYVALMGKGDKRSAEKLWELAYEHGCEWAQATGVWLYEKSPGSPDSMDRVVKWLPGPDPDPRLVIIQDPTQAVPVRGPFLRPLG
jgi:hypothetical protein